MFSIKYPSILSNLGQLRYGFQPVEHPREGRFSLLVKIPKEAILTARLQRELRLYPIPDGEIDARCLGFITAFFDDHDEPLVIYTPLWSGDELLTDLVAALVQDSVRLYFFDEHDREMIGYRASVEDVSRFRSTMESTSFPDLDLDAAPNTLEAMEDWFGRRTTDDDARAFTIHLAEPLFPDDRGGIDLRPETSDFYGAGDTPSTLQRKEPGAFQEHDIAPLLRRVFPGHSIFLNSTRTDSGYSGPRN